MITKIILENFQSHKKTVLDMGKMTVLTGGSNSGKSAVLRALGGLLRNDSVGDYVAHGEKQLHVSIIMDDGHIIDWDKGTGLNQYRVTGPDGAEELYQKVGSDIPEEVADVIGIAPITLEGGQRLHINLHEQLETPFLVGREHTAGFTAKVFGEVTSAAKLQASIQEGNRLIRVDLNRSKVKRTDLVGLDEKLLQFLGLEEQKSLVSKANHYYREAYSLNKEKEALEYAVNDLRLTGDDLFLFSDKVKYLEVVEDIDLNDAIAKAKVIKSLRAIEQEITSSEDKISQLAKWEILIEEANSDDLLAKAKNLVNSVKGLTYDLSHINSISKEISQFTVFAEKVEKELIEVETKIDSLMSELDECPSCGQELTGDAKSHMLGVHTV